MIITDRAAGKGFDPNHKDPGYQLAACSRGIDDRLKGVLYDICVPIGDVVYRCRPASARAKWNEWYESLRKEGAAAGRVVPDEVLKEFPVVHVYAGLEGGLFAFVRVRYAGWTHDNRFNNFLAHALVFKPEELAAYGYNPMALSRSDLFWSTDRGETALETLRDLGTPGDRTQSFALLGQHPFKARAGKAVGALLSARSGGRPVVLCLSDWRQAGALIEDLLNLLAPSARSRMTFCTFTNALPKQGAGERAEAAGSMISVVCADNVGNLMLNPANYGPNAACVVFNFVEDKFTEVDAPTAYTSLAAAAVESGRREKLDALYEVIEKMGLGEDREAWDALTPAAQLAEETISPQAMQDAVCAMAAAAKAPSKAALALDLIMPHVERLAEANKRDILAAIASDFGSILDAAVSGDEAPRGKRIADITGLAVRAFDKGWICTANALVRLCGKQKDNVAMSVLEHGFAVTDGRKAAPATAEDGRQLTEVLLDGVGIVGGKAEDAPLRERLVTALFDAANQAGRTAEVWSAVGEAVVKPMLEGVLDAAKLGILRSIVGQVSEETCPGGYVWLNVRLIKATKPRNEELFGQLERIAAATSRLPGDKVLADVVTMVKEMLAERAVLATALGRMSERAFGTGAGDVFFREYRDAAVPGKTDRDEVRKSLAKAGAGKVLCRELFDEVLPWESPESVQKFQSWDEAVLKTHQKILDAVREGVVRRLQRAGEAGSVLPLAERLLAVRTSEQTPSSVLASLYAAIVLALPLSPLPQRWEKALAAGQKDLKREAKVRFEVLKFMARVSEQSKKANWSLLEFQHGDAAWQALKEMDGKDRDHVVRWCLDTFRQSGITTSEHALRLQQMLSAAGLGQGTDLADAALRLLQRRDTDRLRDRGTCFLVAMAFAQCELDAKGGTFAQGGFDRRSGSWREAFGALVGKLDDGTRRIIEEHFEGRFCRRDDEEYRRRVRRLCEAAGLRAPKESRPEPAPAPRGADRPSAPGEKRGGIAATFKSILSRLMPGREEPEPPLPKKPRPRADDRRKKGKG